ncbi:hypothetical protein C8Q74DRAFT_1373490 [Fomes fomentarius]|nr:hypothetical protein C8Q74DRAFT_1373490 [Fomes fomentarius]
MTIDYPSEDPVENVVVARNSDKAARLLGICPRQSKEPITARIAIPSPRRALRHFSFHKYTIQNGTEAGTYQPAMSFSLADGTTDDPSVFDFI